MELDKIKKNLRKRTERIRFLIQSLFFIATNSFVIGYLQGGIYQGNLKQICVPGLNCYSCPGAVGSCPIGALQAILNKREFSLDASGGLAMTPAYYVPFYDYRLDHDVRRGLRQVYLRLSLPVRAGAGSAPQNPAAEEAENPNFSRG